MRLLWVSPIEMTTLPAVPLLTIAVLFALFPVGHRQWRRYTVVTTGATDASLYVHASAVDDTGQPMPESGMPLSAMYVRRNKVTCCHLSRRLSHMRSRPSRFRRPMSRV
jgi:hypothetical protein